MPKFSIKDIAHCLGDRAIVIADRYPEASSLIAKTGIPVVFESTVSIGELATDSLLKLINRNPEVKIDCLICVSQSSDFNLPGLANFLQQKSGLPSTTFLIDVNQGCAGFVHALFIASKLLDQWSNIVIVCADRYREKLNPADRSTNAVFSDGATATLITSEPESRLEITSLNYVFDGSKIDYLNQSRGHEANNGYLHMDGGRLWGYTRSQVVPLIKRVIEDGTRPETIYIHQASKLVFDGIAQQLTEYHCNLPSNFSRYGNTVSSTIPLLIEENLGLINEQSSVLAGFGVGINAVVLKLETTA
jgi:3-oxoacyl-[acyl-carrier-protein] synthase-3